MAEKKEKKEKKGGLSPKDTRMVLFLLGIVAVACAYFFIFRSNMDSAAEINTQNIELQAQLDSLIAMENTKAETEKDTAEKNAQVEELLKPFPNDMTEEKLIDIVDEMEEKTKVVIPSISFTMNQQFFPDAAMIAAAAQPPAEGEAAAAEGEAASEGEAAPAPAAPVAVEGMINVANLIGYDSSINLTYRGSYEEVKEMVDFINNHEDKMRLKSISMAYNETEGNLQGNVKISAYSLIGNTNEYEPPKINDVRVGIDALFRVTEGAGKGKGNKKEDQE